MTGWQLHVPHRDRSDDLATVAAHARHLPADQRAIARQVALNARLDGVASTAGELIDHLEQLQPAQRRELLDAARAQLGLPPTHEVDIANGAALRHVGQSYRPMAIVRNEVGALVERYADQAEVDAAEANRLAAERESREAQRRVDLAGHEEAERRRREAFLSEVPPHLRGWSHERRDGCARG